MQTLIKPSAAIRQNYTEIATLCKTTGEPVFLTKNGEGDLVVMDITAYNQREKQLELREKLIEIEELRRAGCARDNGEECALQLLDAYDEKFSYLKNTPLMDCGRLRYVPSKYRVLNFWPHLWFVFQVKEDEKCVKI